jgi:hypothetical protein
MEAVTMGMTPRVRTLIIGLWPDRASQWKDSVWDVWADELAKFTENELERAVRYYSRQGSEWPPTCGIIYQIAQPWKEARLARIAEYRYLERMRGLE